MTARGEVAVKKQGRSRVGSIEIIKGELEVNGTKFE